MTSHCMVCGKELTDPISVETGMGPQCRKEAIMSENFEEVIKHLPGQHTQRSHGRRAAGGAAAAQDATSVSDKKQTGYTANSANIGHDEAYAKKWQKHVNKRYDLDKQEIGPQLSKEIDQAGRGLITIDELDAKLPRRTATVMGKGGANFKYPTSDTRLGSKFEGEFKRKGYDALPSRDANVSVFSRDKSGVPQQFTLRAGVSGFGGFGGGKPPMVVASSSTPSSLKMVADNLNLNVTWAEGTEPR